MLTGSSPQAATPEVPFTLLFRGGPSLYLALALLYLIVLAILLRKLNAAAGLFLACGAFCFHVIILYWGSQPSFYPLFELFSGNIRTFIYFSTFVVFIAAFVSILVLRPPQKIVRWLKPVGCTLMLGWVCLLSAAVVKMAFPPSSVWSPVTHHPFTWPRTSSALAYDTQRHRAVLFGGTVRETQPPMFTKRTPGNGMGRIGTNSKPKSLRPAASNHAMAYDSDKEKIYLYGGLIEMARTPIRYVGMGRYSMASPMPRMQSGRTLPTCHVFDPDRKKTHRLWRSWEGYLSRKPGRGMVLLGAKWISPTPYPAFSMICSFTTPLPNKRLVLLAEIGETHGHGQTIPGKELDLVPTAAAAQFHELRVGSRLPRNIYLFGGDRDGKIFSDTWVFDGTAWETVDTSAFATCAMLRRLFL